MIFLDFIPVMVYRMDVIMLLRREVIPKTKKRKYYEED
jgi:hypothetical protein